MEHKLETEAKEILSNLEKQLGEIEGLNASFQVTLITNRQIQKMQDGVYYLETKVTDLTNSKNEWQKEALEYRGKLNRYVEEKASLNARLNQREDEVKKLEAYIKDVCSDLSNKPYNKPFIDTVRYCGKTFKEWEDEANKQDTKIRALHTQTSFLASDISNLEVENRKLNSNIELKAKLVAEYEGKARDYKALYESAQRRISELQEYISSEETKDWRDDVDTLSKQALENQKKEIASLRDQVKRRQDIVDELRLEIDKLKACDRNSFRETVLRSNENLTKEINKLKEENKELTKTGLLLKDKLDKIYKVTIDAEPTIK